MLLSLLRVTNAGEEDEGESEYIQKWQKVPI